MEIRYAYKSIKLAFIYGKFICMHSELKFENNIECDTVNILTLDVRILKKKHPPEIAMY